NLQTAYLLTDGCPQAGAFSYECLKSYGLKRCKSITMNAE
ncbi:MAG: hypothetical protein ACI9KM_000463, partial [Rubritalea sp.]